MSEKPTNYWSSEVTEAGRHDVGDGIFAIGSAQEMAKAVMEAAREEGPQEAIERRAMANLTFYENRGGGNLSAERRAALDEAKAIVRKSGR